MPSVGEKQRELSAEEAKSFLSAVRTRNYIGNSPSYNVSRAILDYSRPIFSRMWIEAMLEDPVIKYGFGILRGPLLSKAKYEVESDDEKVAEFVQKQIERFWFRGARQALQCLVYGYCGLETIYHYDSDDKTHNFKGFKYIHPRDVRPVLKGGVLKGMKVRMIGHVGHRYVGLPKLFWAVHNKEHHRWFGDSRLRGAFIPWYETWQPQGYRNIRHLWLYKHAFHGGVVKYPSGATVVDEVTGESIPNSQLAQEVADKIETGATVILPTEFGEGMGGWDWEPPGSNAVPEGLFTYGDDLRNEKWEGMGVPPEVAQSEDTGSFAGRRVPQQAFYSSEQEIADEIMYDFDEQNIQPLVGLNFGQRKALQYEIKPVPILQTLQQEEMGVVTGSLPGDEEEMEGTENELSNGRIEDRGSNAHNLREKGAASAQKKKG